MSDSGSIRVIIVDDQAIVRSGLSAFLMAFDELQLVGEAGDGEEAVQLCEIVRPDVVLMDLKMPRMDGITATRIIHQRWPHIRVLILTSFKDKYLVQGALDAGAHGYLLKDLTAQELSLAIREVHRGRRAVAEAATQALAQAERLEQLVAEIQDSRPELADLPELLSEYLPEVFPSCQVQVRIFPDRDLWLHPSPPVHVTDEAAWEWLQSRSESLVLAPGEPDPWSGRPAPGSGCIFVPIEAGLSDQPIGGIHLTYLEETEDPTELLPAVRTLANQVSEVVDQAPGSRRAVKQDAEIGRREVHTQELATAGKIQASILPGNPPRIPGWEVAGRLSPARETSGDFYDFLPLANGKWGFVIADVTDKGMGAALFMALSSTLLRTYAAQYPQLPALAMQYVNDRILSDTGGSMFVTAFYGVLEPGTGRLRYVNAGHNPPILVSALKGKTVNRLRGTGMALGVMEKSTWQQKIVRFTPGDVLLLYTDGVTEAQNRQGDYFGEGRLVEAVRNRIGRPAEEVLEGVLADVHHFLGSALQPDDIALVVLRRTR